MYIQVVVILASFFFLGATNHTWRNTEEATSLKLSQLEHGTEIAGPLVRFLPEDLLLHFLKRFWLDLKYIFLLGLSLLLMTVVNVQPLKM